MTYSPNPILGILLFTDSANKAKRLSIAPSNQ